MLDLLLGFPTHGSCAAFRPGFAASAVAEAASSEKHTGLSPSSPPAEIGGLYRESLFSYSCWPFRIIRCNSPDSNAYTNVEHEFICCTFLVKKIPFHILFWISLISRYLFRSMTDWFTLIFLSGPKVYEYWPVLAPNLYGEYWCFFQVYVRVVLKPRFVPFILAIWQMYMKLSSMPPDKLLQVVQRKSHVWPYKMKTR